MKTIYVVSWRWYRPSLMRVEVEEKAKTYQVVEAKAIVGTDSYYAGQRISKDDPTVYDNLPHALLGLIERGEEKAQAARDELARLEDDLYELKKAFDELNK